jgi:transcriptional regulator with XRE-family HTH domain
VRLRERLGETQYEFAARLRVTPVSIARYETFRAPSKTILERLYRLASKHDPGAAQVFRRAIEDAKQAALLRRRMGEILHPANVQEAGTRLRELWADAGPWIPLELPTDRYLTDMQALADLRQLRLEEAQSRLDEVYAAIQKLADLLLIGGRKDLEEK